MPTAYLHVRGRIFTIFNKYLMFIFHQASQSKSDHALHIARDSVCSSRNINCPVRTAEQHCPCWEKRQMSILGKVSCEVCNRARNCSKISISHATWTDNIFAHSCGRLTIVFWTMEENSFTAWGQLVCVRASPRSAVTSRQTRREN